MKSVFGVAVLAGIIGCGDNNHLGLDAGTTPVDSRQIVDTPPLVDAPPISCNYQEQQDATNDYNYFGANSGIEQTGLHYTGSTLSICGVVDTGSAHYDTNFKTIDVDNYGITVDQDSDVLITLTTAGSDFAAMNAISSVELIAFSDQTNGNVASSFWATPGGNHAVVSAHLFAGTYELGMQAADNPNAATITGPAIPYAMTISADNPTTRCAAFTGTASYTEMGDGPDNHANDTVEIDMFGDAEGLLAGSNTPENTLLTLAPSTSYLITGDSAAVAAATETYFDMDTYVVTPGPNTDQISVRLDWDNQTANLDYYLFKAGHLGPESAFITASTSDDEEFGTAAVTPGMPYWISVGEFAPSGSMSVDATYSLTVCAETFVPPPN